MNSYKHTKPIIFICFAMLLTACTVNIKPPLSDGSKSDGMVEFAAEISGFVNPEIDFATMQDEAARTCKGWGYKDAKYFTNKSQCSLANNHGCIAHRHVYKYQCRE